MNKTSRNTIFVYGSLLRGLGNHYRLDGQEFLGAAKVSGFDMVDLGAYPGIVDGSGEIVGELFSVNDWGLDSLDQLEGHPNFYKRRRVNAVMADDGDRTCWIYVLVRGERYRDRERVKSGDWKQHKIERRDKWIRTGRQPGLF